ncbi:MAG: hypothetical protein N4A40_13205 [Tissierellales bacterium]|jgi:hypothetical protein|nr:hypothetical protein [Tissierellales bacterium]
MSQYIDDLVDVVPRYDIGDVVQFYYETPNGLNFFKHIFKDENDCKYYTELYNSGTILEW